MQGYGLLFFLCHYLRLLFQSADNAVDGIQKVLFAYGVLVVPCCYQCRLVAHVGNVGTAEPGCLSCQQIYIYRVVHLERTHMYFENLLAFRQTRQLHLYLSVEAAGPKQGFVQYVSAVGGCQYNDAAVCPESIHLCKQLVQGVFALVVAS